MPEYIYSPEFMYTRVFFAHAKWTLDPFYGNFNIGCLCICMWKLSKMLLNWGGGLAGSMQMARNFMVMKNSSSGGCLPLSRGYIHAHDHNIERYK